MTWTYGGTPGSSTAAERRDSVRYLVGDTDTSDQQTTDEEISFALTQASNNVYGAASIVCRAIAAKYARLVSTSFDSVRIQYGERQDHYEKLAVQREREAKRFGGGLGTPVAGGISISEMDAVEDDADRPQPAFRRGQFENPPDNVDDRKEYYQ